MEHSSIQLRMNEITALRDVTYFPEYRIEGCALPDRENLSLILSGCTVREVRHYLGCVRQEVTHLIRTLSHNSFGCINRR